MSKNVIKKQSYYKVAPGAVNIKFNFLVFKVFLKPF